MIRALLQKKTILFIALTPTCTLIYLLQRHINYRGEFKYYKIMFSDLFSLKIFITNPKYHRTKKSGT